MIQKKGIKIRNQWKWSRITILWSRKYFYEKTKTSVFPLRSNPEACFSEDSTYKSVWQKCETDRSRTLSGSEGASKASESLTSYFDKYSLVKASCNKGTKHVSINFKIGQIKLQFLLHSFRADPSHQLAWPRALGSGEEQFCKQQISSKYVS